MVSTGKRLSGPQAELAFYKAGYADTTLLAALHELSFGTDRGAPWTPDAFAQLIAMPGTTTLVAMRIKSSVPLGFVVFRVAAEECEIVTLGVHPDARRKAVATRLLRHMFERVQDAGVTRVFLEVAADNPAGRSFYYARGFTEVGMRPGYYYRPGADQVDARVLQRILPGDSL